jgi:hypothetical protein
MDPHNPVNVVFFRKAGINPNYAPQPNPKEPIWKAPEPDIAAQFRLHEDTSGQRALKYYYQI